MATFSISSRLREAMSNNAGQVLLNVVLVAAAGALFLYTYNLHIDDQNRIARDGERITALESMANDMKDLDQHLDDLHKLLAPGRSTQSSSAVDQNTSSVPGTGQPRPESLPATNDTQPNTDSGTNASVVPTQPSQNPAHEQFAAHVFVDGPVSIELSGCRANGTTAVCGFLVRNTGSDSYFNFYTDESHVYDDRGYEAKAVDAAFADHRIVNDSIWGRIVFARMISNVPTSAEFRFEKISSDSTAIALIELRMDVNHSQKFDVRMRDVPLGR
jgi:hypothetical protein